MLALLADKGCDANKLLAWREMRQIQAVIPLRSHRLEQRSCDWHLYKKRHVIECLFSRLKHYGSPRGMRRRPAISSPCWPSRLLCSGYC